MGFELAVPAPNAFHELEVLHYSRASWTSPGSGVAFPQIEKVSHSSGPSGGVSGASSGYPRYGVQNFVGCLLCRHGLLFMSIMATMILVSDVMSLDVF